MILYKEKRGIMKKILLILGILIFGNFVCAEDTVLTGGVTFDWVNMEQIQRDEAIQNYKNIIFGNSEETNYDKKELKEKYKEYLKDTDYKTHYRLANAGIKETENARLCAFFAERPHVLYMYALQYKNKPERVFYYTPYGKLMYVDEMSENYPNFPYYSKQYRINGNMVGAIYFTDKDTQYTYEPDGKFKGVWHLEKMFDNKAKLIMTRTNW